MTEVIAQFRCNTCNKSYASYQSLWIHNKKYHNNISQHNNNISQHNNNISQHNDISKYKCKFCSKIYKHQQSKSRHEKICKINTNNNINIINNNIVNTNSNNTINNTVNTKIIINKLGDENILHLSKSEVMEIFNKELESITTMIELLNFNERR